MTERDEIRAKVLASDNKAAKNAMILSDIFMLLAEDEAKEKQANESPTGQSK